MLQVIWHSKHLMYNCMTEDMKKLEYSQYLRIFYLQVL